MNKLEREAVREMFSDMRTATVRTFEGGATRDLADGKLSYIRFLSPHVLTRYCQYLEAHRDTAAGRRDQDNWKAGIPLAVYHDSLGRHFWSVWTAYEEKREVPMEDLMALLFNAFGIAYEVLKEQRDAS